LAWFHWVLSVFFFGLVFFLSFPVAKAFEGMELFSIPIPTNARYYAATAGSLLACFVLAAKLFKPRKGT
jgi:TRAP-type C4-dicarboxylate transport system permease small subunit